MTSTPEDARILIVANRTASTPLLLDEVTRRAGEGAQFTLLIPPEKHAQDGDDWSSDVAVSLLTRAAGRPVEHLDCGPDAFAVIHGAVDDGTCDEIILSVPPAHLTRWFHHDLRHRLQHLALPVRVIPPEADAPPPDDLPDGWTYPPPTPGVAGTY
jgi:hypothetical protein